MFRYQLLCNKSNYSRILIENSEIFIFAGRLRVCSNLNIATATVKPVWSLYILSIHCHYFFLSGLRAFSSHHIIFAISAGSKTNRRNSRFYPGLWTVHIFPERLVFEILSAIGLYHHYTIQQWRRKMQLRWTGIY